MIETAKKIAADIQRRKSVRPDIGLVLGSGWGKAAEGITALTACVEFTGKTSDTGNAAEPWNR